MKTETQRNGTPRKVTRDGGGWVVLAMQMQGCDSQTRILAFTLPLKLRQLPVWIISKSPE